jgi:CheY-like chemotaxis protein
MERPSSRAKPLVLISDDEPVVLRALARMTGRCGAEPVTDANGDVLSRAIELQPDLILLDVQQPACDGEEVLRRLKAHSATAHIPVVVLSVLDSLDRRIQMLRDGAENYILKPVDIIFELLLTNTLRRTVERHGPDRPAAERSRPQLAP